MRIAHWGQICANIASAWPLAAQPLGAKTFTMLAQCYARTRHTTSLIVTAVAQTQRSVRRIEANTHGYWLLRCDGCHFTGLIRLAWRDGHGARRRSCGLRQYNGRCVATRGDVAFNDLYLGEHTDPFKKSVSRVSSSPAVRRGAPSRVRRPAHSARATQPWTLHGLEYRASQGRCPTVHRYGADAPLILCRNGFRLRLDARRLHLV